MMAYTKQDWKNDDPDTPLSAKRLNHIESGIADKADSGSDGKSVEFKWDGTKLGVRQEGASKYEYTDLKGADGTDGNDGDDGFPSETDWNDLKDRVEALEAE